MSTTSSLAVLMYHQIADEGSKATAEWRISLDTFEQQLAWLRDTGHVAISLDELQAFLGGATLADPRSIVLTFDDGHRDFYANALPLLNHYSFGAVVFVVTDQVGKTSVWDRDLDSDIPLMDWPVLRELVAGGIEIASHSRDHVSLDELRTDEVSDQLLASRDAINAELGVSPSALAYPFGARNESVIQATASAGYALAFGTHSGRVTHESNRFDIERLRVTEEWTPRHMAERLACRDQNSRS